MNTLRINRIKQIGVLFAFVFVIMLMPTKAFAWTDPVLRIRYYYGNMGWSNWYVTTQSTPTFGALNGQATSSVVATNKSSSYSDPNWNRLDSNEGGWQYLQSFDLSLEANNGGDGGILYSAWQRLNGSVGAVTSGQVTEPGKIDTTSGYIVGERLPLGIEDVNIQLTGGIASRYDINYQIHTFKSIYRRNGKQDNYSDTTNVDKYFIGRNGSYAGTRDNGIPIDEIRVWLSPKQWTNTFDSRGGNTGTFTLTTAYGSTAMAHVQTPYRTGYTFLGWYNTDGTCVYDQNGNTTGACTVENHWTHVGDLSLHAEYQINAYFCNVNMNMPDGTEGGGAVGTFTASADGGANWGGPYSDQPWTNINYGTNVLIGDIRLNPGLRLASVTGDGVNVESIGNGIYRTIMPAQAATININTTWAHNNLDVNPDNNVYGEDAGRGSRISSFDVYGADIPTQGTSDFNSSVQYGSDVTVANIKYKYGYHFYHADLGTTPGGNDRNHSLNIGENGSSISFKYDFDASSWLNIYTAPNKNSILIYDDNNPNVTWFDVEGAEGDKSSDTSFEGKSTFDNPITISNLQFKPGYHFGGVDLSETNGNKHNDHLIYDKETGTVTYNSDIDAPLLMKINSEPNTYSIKFDTNGGQGTISDQSFTFDTSGTLKDDTPTKDGEDFVYWSENKDGSGKRYYPGDSILNLTSEENGTVTVYAQYNTNMALEVPTKVMCCIKADGSVITPTNWEVKNVGKLDIEIDNVSPSNSAKNIGIQAKIKNSPWFSFSNKNIRSISIEQKPSIFVNKTENVNWSVDRLDPRNNFETIKEALEKPSRLSTFTFTWHVIR